MNNILIDELPQKALIDGAKYEINSDFRAIILFELLIQDKTLDDRSKVFGALKLFYPVIPPDVFAAFEYLLWFYRLGKPESDDTAAQSHSTKAYCFDQDARYIFASFMQQYTLDLNAVDYLHWWKYKALFDALGEETQMAKIICIAGLIVY